MKMSEIYREHKDAIFRKWFRHIVSSYPRQSADLFSDTNKQFTNPLAYNLNKFAQQLSDAIFDEQFSENINKPLEEIIKIRAVQDFSSADAVSFIFKLKDTLRSECGAYYKDEALNKVMIGIEDRIDRTILIAFDIFMNTRERIYEIKANEIKARTFKMIDRLTNKYEKMENKNDEINQSD